MPLPKGTIIRCSSKKCAKDLYILNKDLLDGQRPSPSIFQALPGVDEVSEYQSMNCEYCQAPFGLYDLTKTRIAIHTAQGWVPKLDR